jgi:AraC-like DNA-binding protein
VALLVDTADVAPRERREYWSEASSHAYHPVQIRSGASTDFWARMWGCELGPLGLFRIVAAPNTMLRTSRAIAAGDPECIHVEVLLSGQLNAAQEGRTGIARAGDIVSYETSHPALFRADRPFESLVLRVPRRLLGADAARIAGLTAVPIPGRSGLPRAAVAFFRGLAARLDRAPLSAPEAATTVSYALDLVRRLSGATPAADEPRRARSRADILLDVETFVDANLGHADLDPADVARASYISVRYLHKLFADEGTSVCAWIRHARLEGCRRDLADPALDHQPIVAIASRWGLPVPQHFSRLFRAAYGCSPREYRARRGSAS